MAIYSQDTASFDVDPQCGFTPLCPDELPVADGDAIVNELNAQAGYARLRLVSKDCHPAQAPWIATTPQEILQPVAGDYPDLDVKWPAHCVVGTRGNQLIPGLPAEQDYDLVVEKGMDPVKHPYGACYHDLSEQTSTGVIEWLRDHGIHCVVVGGLATDFCVKTTALQLARNGFTVVVNLAACRGVAEESSAAALEEMRQAGVVLIAASRELEAA